MKKGFVSYAHADVATVTAFRRDLKGLEHDYDIEFWIDPDLRAGEKWKTVIQAKIAEADIILLLMSRAFLASDFIRQTEWPWIRQREVAAKARVIPVILEDCRWGTTWGRYQGVPRGKDGLLPIVKWDPDTEGMTRAAEQIERVMISVLGMTNKEHPEPEAERSLKQVPGGPNWFQQDQQFRIDPGGGLTDEQIARHPDTRRRFEHLREMAERLGKL